jgi:uncharacterized membrane protein YcgQ (UPF0703/DUF1980 family)
MRNPLKQYENTKEWKDTSDDWVKTMTQSKENKEEYQRYAEKRKSPMPYRDWLRNKR